MQITTTINVKDFNTAKMILDNPHNSWYELIPPEYHIKFLSISNQNGWTIAHELAHYGYKFTTEEILKLKTNIGWSVAHEMAQNGYKFNDQNILYLTDHLYQTVEDIMNKCGNPVIYNTYSNLQNDCGVIQEVIGYEYTINDCNFKIN